MPDLPRIQYAMLALLGERGRMHAYEIKRVLKDEVGHSSVYAALSAVEAKGLVQAEWVLPGSGSEGGGPPRKYFQLTITGRQAVRVASKSRRAGTHARRRAAQG